MPVPSATPRRLSRPVVAGVTLALLMASALSVAAQSPTAGQAPSPSASPVAAVPAPLPPRPPRPDWTPSGPPDATLERDGLMMAVWLSDAVAEPGSWVMAHVRVTNTGRRTRFHEAAGVCVGEPFAWRVDTTALFDAGRSWPGAAGRLKRELTRYSPIPPWVRPEEMDGTGVVGLAECMGSLEPGVGRLRPGRSITSDHALYPEYTFGRPLPPGPLTIEVSFNDWGDGRGPDRDHAPLSMAPTVLVAGPDPGYPSPLVLIDRALSVPDFYRYVVASAGHREWTNAHWLAWPSIPAGHLRGLGQAPNGFLGIGLFGEGSGFYEVDLDPWTGEVLAFGPR